MKLENREFLKKVEESAKFKKKTMSKLQEEILNIKAIEPDLDEEDIACVIMAANEVEGMKIFPATPETKMKAFEKMVLMYTQDEEVTMKGVKAYLRIKNVSWKKNDKKIYLFVILIWDENIVKRRSNHASVDDDFRN